MRPAEYRPLTGIASCRDLPVMTAPNEEVFDPDIVDGTVLDDRFVVHERISRSRLSTVYRGEDLHRDRIDVAIKMPLLQVESDPVGFAQFRREESIGTQLQHPGLLKFIPVAARAGRAYLVTEYLDGCTLGDLLHQNRPLPEDDALAIVAAVALALAHLHERGVVHRDLKPANIVLCRDGSLRVIDFGQSGPITRKRSLVAALTPVVGTPEYIAPEQVEHRPNDERTDIYSLGAILYEMLTGVVPFKTEDTWTTAYRRTTGDPIAPRALNPTLSPQAEEIVLHAMQRDPSNRYGSMNAFAADLMGPADVTVTGYAMRLKRPRWKLSFHGTPLVAGVLIGLVAVTALVVLFLTLVRFHPGR